MSVHSDQISAVIICKNAEAHILEVVTALRELDEILVYDTGSNDRTLEILAECDWVTVVKGEFLGFGQTKSCAVIEAENNWILSVDADEVVNSDLIDACRALTLEHSPRSVGRIYRRNYFANQEIHHAGWGQDWIVRFFNRTHTNFNETPVHEAVQTLPDSQVIKLKGYIKHYAVDRVEQLACKSLFYSTLRKTPKQSVTVAVIKATWKFVQTYIIRLGLLDGRRGLLIAFANAIGVFWRHTFKLFEKR